MGGYRLSLTTNDSVDEVPRSAWESFLVPADEIRRNGARKRENLVLGLGGEDLEVRGAGTEPEEGKGSGVVGSFAIAFLRRITSALPPVNHYSPALSGTH